MLIFFLLVIKIVLTEANLPTDYTKPIHQTSICQVTDLPIFFLSVSFTTSFLPLSPLASQLGLANIHLACFKIQMARISGTSVSGLLMGPQTPLLFLLLFLPNSYLWLLQSISHLVWKIYITVWSNFFFFWTKNVVNWPLPTALRKWFLTNWLEIP